MQPRNLEKKKRKLLKVENMKIPFDHQALQFSKTVTLSIIF